MGWDMWAAAQPPASSKPSAPATGSPSNESPVKLTLASAISNGQTAVVPMDASVCRPRASPTVQAVPFPSLSHLATKGATHETAIRISNTYVGVFGSRLW